MRNTPVQKPQQHRYEHTIHNQPQRPRRTESFNDELQIMDTAVVRYDANEFTGERILVTGGSKGIGGAIVMMMRRRSVNLQI